MNCSEWEGLLDAYLDGQLSGALRLEFDAHRLRCRRCQQSLAMMEAITHVVATDERSPAISDDFTQRVMSQILSNKPAAIRPRWTRV
ncbi:MAG: zf-HC2 domain-containing protein, partial [Phycisphaerales bacterium]|nr:zf-HC2 domain-containing protein [Phycisphaerales bacterium]